MKIISVCIIVLSFFKPLVCLGLPPHDIIFCGEHVPVESNFVSTRLMNFINGQKNNVSYPELRRRKEQYFPTVEYYLRATGLPEDFKYLVIVESGFTLETSSTGAQGYWQIMPEAAKEFGLKIDGGYDERNDINKSTYAACKILASYYKQIQKRFNVSSWVLTAAAYNFGIGNISKAISNQGKDYFSMSLNAETASYVYKIIAVKELFEFPELYMKSFGYNIFNTSTASVKAKPIMVNSTVADASIFNTVEVKVNENDGQHAKNIEVPKDIEVPTESEITKKIQPPLDLEHKKKLVVAHVVGKYKKIKDGDKVVIMLEQDFKVKGKFIAEGGTIKGTAWVIDDRVFIDLGYKDHDVLLYDLGSVQGIAILNLKKNNAPLLLKIDDNDD